jgi:hypothetical protein
VLRLRQAVQNESFVETLAVSNPLMCGLAWMLNDDNVDNAQMCSETHVRNHDISLLKPPRRMGGILVSRPRYYQKVKGKVNINCCGKDTYRRIWFNGSALTHTHGRLCLS